MISLQKNIFNGFNAKNLDHFCKNDRTLTLFKIYTYLPTIFYFATNLMYTNYNYEWNYAQNVLKKKVSLKHRITRNTIWSTSKLLFNIYYVQTASLKQTDVPLKFVVDRGVRYSPCYYNQYLYIWVEDNKSSKCTKNKRRVAKLKKEE